MALDLVPRVGGKNLPHALQRLFNELHRAPPERRPLINQRMDRETRKEMRRHHPPEERCYPPKRQRRLRKLRKLQSYRKWLRRMRVWPDACREAGRSTATLLHAPPGFYA